MHDMMRCVEGMLGLGVHVCHMRFRKKLCCAERVLGPSKTLHGKQEDRCLQQQKQNRSKANI